MKEEIKKKLELIEEKLKGFEVGSVQHNMYVEIRTELLARLNKDKVANIRLHKESEEICDSCQ